MIELAVLSIIIIIMIVSLRKINREGARHNKVLEDHLHFLDEEVDFHKNVIDDNNKTLEDYENLKKKK